MAHGTRVTDTEQEAVVSAIVTERQVVESAPGCGKTDVACARAVSLTAAGVPAPQILFLSFTRTAVREIRSRMRSIAQNNDDVRGVDVRTIDSWAWWFVHHCSTTSVTTNSFDQRIRKATELLKNPSPQSDDYLSTLQHVQIDEAQDLVGPRAEMIKLLLESLRNGWTVYLDPAQAIYEWSEDGARENGDTFVKILPKLLKDKRLRAIQRKLSTDHRASSDQQKTLLRESRQIVLDAKAAPATRLRRKLLTGAKLLEPADFVKTVKVADADTLMLFRTRAECLEASKWLSDSGVVHRLRMGAMPRVVEAWIATVVNAIGEKEFNEAELTLAVSKRAKELHRLYPDADPWRVLRKLAQGSPSKRISVSKLAEGLRRHTNIDDVVQKDVGPDGPVLGTVHGSKGREANVVFAFLQAEPRTDENEQEEARVIYVALSRARGRYESHLNTPLPSAFTDTGRVWRFLENHKRPNIRVEIGREGDVDPIGAIAAAESPAAQQLALANWNRSFWSLRAERVNEPGFEDRPYRHVLYRIDPNNDVIGVALGSLSQAWQDEIFSQVVKRAKWAYTPKYFNELRLIGTSTVAAPDGHPLVPKLPEPFKTTCIWLAPVVLSWAHAMAPSRGRR